MEIQASRLPARTTESGEAVLIGDQDRTRWDRLLIERGLAALKLAEALREERGYYTLQAAIAGCHARAHSADETDWPRIASLYEALAALAPSAVVQLNRAVAVAMAFGPEAGLPLVEALIGDKVLERYHLLPSVHADLLAKLGRHEEARAELERAASLARNTRERAMLLERAAACAPRDSG
jgi:predicted RNA polymerase sigma factor